MRHLLLLLALCLLAACTPSERERPATAPPEASLATMPALPTTQVAVSTPRASLPAPPEAPAPTLAPPEDAPTTPSASPPAARNLTRLHLPLIAGAAPSPTAPPVAVAPPTAVPPSTIPPSNPTATPPRPTPPPQGVTIATPSPEPEAEHLALREDLPALGLTDWPRPANDNGRCMHWLSDQYFTEEQLNINLPRLQQLGAKWALVVYADENIIKMAAPRFAAAGIVPVWRRMLRPFERYYDWERDVKLVESYGLPPYFQIYNEPSLGQEWTDAWEGSSDEGLFLDNLMQASRDVYNAGGYVGWQFVNQEWLHHAIDEVQRRQGTRLFERFFFIPHPYGENLPPNWTEDGRGVLSFTQWSDLLQQRLGFRPMMIAGEGGWRINGRDEPRFAQMDEATHARYHAELFSWFRTGTLSNGQPLPDYFFAYCPWLLSAKGDDNAWWDSFAGDRIQTIQAISIMPPFVRRFSWE